MRVLKYEVWRVCGTEHPWCILYFGLCEVARFDAYVGQLTSYSTDDTNTLILTLTMIIIRRPFTHNKPAVKVNEILIRLIPIRLTNTTLNIRLIPMYYNMIDFYIRLILIPHWTKSRNSYRDTGGSR